MKRTGKERFFSWLYKLFGWKVEGVKPDLAKYVIIVAPHTSNYDFFVGYGGKYLIGFHPNFLGKKELFKIPILGWFLRSIGGHPVDRSKKTNLVDQIVDLYKKNDNFIMTITPEGTRSYSPEWKTGFYRIAMKAKIPIVKVALDYATKTLSIAEPFYPSGDMEREIAEIQKYYKQFRGKYPEKEVK